MAEITWLGHACFRIQGREAVILTDPIESGDGFEGARKTADIVTLSHPLPNDVSLIGVGPKTRVISGPGEYEVADVFITGIRSHAVGGVGRSQIPNTIYLFELEDLVICHLGDLTQPLTEEQAGAMSSVDVLIVPVGGGPTIGAAAAVEVIGQIEPAVVIPMQFATERGGQDGDREGIGQFLKQVGSPEITPLPRLNLKKSDLGETMQVVVLRP